MPRTKAKRPRKTKKKKSKDNIGIYILLAIVCAGLLYWLTKPDGSVPVNSSQHAEQASEQANTTQQRTIPARPKPAEGETEIDQAIHNLAEQLAIPEKSIKRRQRSDKISYSIPIDPNALDLSYANMLVKNEIEKNKGEFLSGNQESKRHKLSIQHKESKQVYDLDLYYDEKTFKDKKPTKSIAIVVDDFGDIGGELLDDFLKLDPNICFAIMPDTPNSVITMQRAHAQGRETLIHIPMEPVGYPKNNPGKNAIFVHMNEHEIDRAISRFANTLSLCKGANNHMGSLATADDIVMRNVMNSLHKHKLYFLDSRTTQISVAYQTAQKAHIPAFRNDLFLDAPDLSNKTFDTKIDQILSLVASKKQVIAITHCHTKQHLDYLKNVIRRLKQEGFEIVPVSRIGQIDVPPIS